MKYDLSVVVDRPLQPGYRPLRVSNQILTLVLFPLECQCRPRSFSFFAIFFSSRHLSVLRFLWRLSKSSVCSTLVANSSNLLTFCGIVTRLRYWIFRQGLAGFLRFFLAFGFSPVFLRRARRRCIPNLASLRRFVFRDSDSSFRRLRCFSARLKYLT